jgi:cytoskeletal protein CcmA (bactofilin family)
MKGLFRGQEKKEGKTDTSERGAVVMEEKARKKERLPGGSDNINAFIGEGTSFKGSLTFEGTVRVDGKLEGEVITKDTLLIGSSAEVRADIQAGALVIGGSVYGNVTAEKKIELHSGARLYGNIITPSLVIDEGVVFEGNCTMGRKQNLPAEKKAAQKTTNEQQKVPVT